MTYPPDQNISVSVQKRHILALFEFHEAKGVDLSGARARARGANQPSLHTTILKITRQNVAFLFKSPPRVMKILSKTKYNREQAHCK